MDFGVYTQYCQKKPEATESEFAIAFKNEMKK